MRRVGRAVAALPLIAKNAVQFGTLRMNNGAKPYFTHIRRVTRNSDSVAVRKALARSCGLVAR
jgi:hypothetical protein